MLWGKGERDIQVLTFEGKMKILGIVEKWKNQDKRCGGISDIVVTVIKSIINKR